MTDTRADGSDLRRRLPSVDEVLRQDWARALEDRYGRASLLRHLRALLDEVRESASRGDSAELAEVVASLSGRLARRLERAASPSLVPVINATGVIIHTNLGRAPLSPEAAARVARVASSYSNLEYDLEAGDRGNREVHAEGRLREMVGAEGTVVVNNNAAAVLLAVNTLAEGREVLVSRGELVEIGGSFRIPDVVGKSGATLREVGTTNRTRLSDYRAAIGPDTGLILKVHPSNFVIVGFTESTPTADLAALAHSAGVAFVEDLGSGLLSPLPGLEGERTVAESLAAGVDLVTFSGDKLLGGPQAGIVVGRRDLVDRLAENPLRRALRPGKLTLAALGATLRLYRESPDLVAALPVLRWLTRPLASMEQIGREVAPLLAARLGDGYRVSLVAAECEVGSGAVPAVSLPSRALAVEHAAVDVEEIAARFRAARPPVLGRIHEGRFLLDLRGIFEPAELAVDLG